MRLAGTIERRLLVNWRADPDVLQRLLPAGLRPQIVNGSAIVGICLVRLANSRPLGIRRAGAIERLH